MSAALRFLIAVMALFSLACSQEDDIEQGALTSELEDTPDEIEQDDNSEQEILTSHQMRALHAKIDSNGDSKISLEEIMGHAAEMSKILASKDVHTVIVNMDGDKDGKLSLPELLKDMETWGEMSEDAPGAQMRKDHEVEKFKVADVNGDGILDVEELPSYFYPRTNDKVLTVFTQHTLQQKDSNGDGKLTLKEFWDIYTDEEIPEEEKSDFRKLDTNGDGLLSLEELKPWESDHFHVEEAMKKLIELSDKDSDMQISLDELDDAGELIAGSNAQYHMMEWAVHHEL